MSSSSNSNNSARPPRGPTNNNNNNMAAATVTPTRNNNNPHNGVNNNNNMNSNSVNSKNVKRVNLSGAIDQSKPQPPPPNTSPYRSQKQSEELEALRQRGLAKLLNKHFTETTQKLAAEKAAVDAALRDLEERKTSPKALSQTTPTQRTQMDDMYHRIHQMKAECRQKERETLLLYQRYVHKFGFTGQIKAPPPTEGTEKGAAGTASTPSKKKDWTAKKSNLTSTGTGGSGSPGTGTAANATGTSSAKRLSSIQDVSGELQMLQLAASDPTPPESPHFRTTASMTAKKPAHAVVLGAFAPDDTPPSTPQQGQQEEPHTVLLSKYLESKNQQGRRNRSSVPEEGGPPPAAPDFSGHLEDDDDLSSLISGLTSVDSATTRQILLDCELTVATFLDEERKAIQAIMDEDSQSHYSGGTGASQSRKSGHSKINNNDKKNQQQQQQQGHRVGGAMSVSSTPSRRSTGVQSSVMMDGEGPATNIVSSNRSLGAMSQLTFPTEVHSIQTQAVSEAETMAQQMQQILKDFQQQQNSSVNDDSLTVATSSSGTPSSRPLPAAGRPYPTANPQEQWVVLWDDQYQREYYHETVSGQTQWHAPSLANGGDMQFTDRDLVLDVSDVMPDHMTISANTTASERIQKYRAKRKRRRRKRILRAVAAAVAVLAICAGAYYYNYHYVPQQAAQQEQQHAREAAAATEQSYQNVKPQQKQQRRRQQQQDNNANIASLPDAHPVGDPSRRPPTAAAFVVPTATPMAATQKEEKVPATQQTTTTLPQTQTQQQRQDKQPASPPASSSFTVESDLPSSTRYVSDPHFSNDPDPAAPTTTSATTLLPHAESNIHAAYVANNREQQEQQQQQEEAQNIPPSSASYHARESRHDDSSHHAPHQVDFPKLQRPWGCNLPFVHLLSGTCRRLAREVPMFDASGLVQCMMQ